jgi:hypothetical protein
MLYATNPEYTVSSDEMGALSWLGDHPSGIVLSEARMGLYVPAYSSDPVYVGQYSETYNYRAKAREARAVLTGNADAVEFAESHGVRYVLWTAREDGGGAPEGLGDPAYDTPGARIYVVRT